MFEQTVDLEHPNTLRNLSELAATKTLIETFKKAINALTVRDSLRAGLATSAAQNGAEERHIMAQTGHKSVQMVRRYIRDGDLFRDNVSGQVGL